MHGVCVRVCGSKGPLMTESGLSSPLRGRRLLPVVAVETQPLTAAAQLIIIERLTPSSR